MKKVIRKTNSFWVSLLSTLLILTSVFVNPAQIDAATVSQQQIVKKVIASGTKDATELYIIDSGKPGPVVMVVGGIHGDGLAGYKAAATLKNYVPAKGKLLVLPEANKKAIALNKRIVPGEADLNRVFPQSSTAKSSNVLAEAIFKTVKDHQVEWIIDLHEDKDFYSTKPGTYTGQTIIHNEDSKITPVAEKIVAGLNTDISDKNKQYKILRLPAQGSLVRSAYDVLGVKSFILETSSKQTLNQRTDEHLKAVQILLTHLNMKSSDLIETIEPVVKKVTLVPGTKDATDLYIIDSKIPGPVVMVVGGIHGDGLAGYKAAATLKNYVPAKGKLLVLPEANKRAIALNKRIVPGENDLNRVFPQSSTAKSSNVLAEAIFKTVKDHQVEWIIDLHEDKDFYSTKPGTYTGQTIIHNEDSKITPVAEKIAAGLNAYISDKNKEYKILRLPAPGSLVRSAYDVLGVKSFILETSSKQTLNQRTDEHLRAVQILLIHLNMKSTDLVESIEPVIKKVTLVPGTRDATDLYIIDSQKPGPVVMITGGVHGSEIAGVQGAYKFTEISVKKGKLLVLPEANTRAVAIKKRTASGQSDLNRMFPQSSSASPQTALSRAIYSTVKDYKVEWLMDMHEGFDYYKNTKTNSVGQTLIHYPSASMTPMANKIVSELNKDISKSLHKYSVLKYPVKGSLARSSGQYLGVNAFIFETSMKQTLTTRVNQQVKAANTLLRELGMI